MDIFLALLAGVPMTLLLTFGSLAIGAVLGVPLVLMRRSSKALVHLPARAVIEIARGIPPIVWLFIIFFGVGASLPDLSPLAAALIGLGVISAGYMAEIYRGGWVAVGHGQEEAADALGLRRGHTLADVIGPQVFRVSLPAAAGYGIGLLKDSSVAYTIGVTEVMYFANEQSKSSSDAMTPFLIAALVYIIMTVPCAWGARALDARLRKAVSR
ncbi:amino acid ABC transporter permease [Mariniluteicoccus flavus]